MPTEQVSNTLQLWTKWIITVMMAMRKKIWQTYKKVFRIINTKIIRSLLTDNNNNNNHKQHKEGWTKFFKYRTTNIIISSHWAMNYGYFLSLKSIIVTLLIYLLPLLLRWYKYIEKLIRYMQILVCIHF